MRISADGAKPAQIARVRRRSEGEEGGYMEEEGDCGQRREIRRKKGAVMGETAGAVSGYCDEMSVYPGGDGGTERGHGVGSSNGRGQGPVLGRRRGPAPASLMQSPAVSRPLCRPWRLNAQPAKSIHKPFWGPNEWSSAAADY